PPVVALSSPAAGAVTGTNVTVAGRVTDAVSGVASLEAQVDAGAFAPVTLDASGNFSFPTALALDGSADGGHTVTLRAADRVGNLSASPGVSFLLDTRPPVVTVTGPASGQTTNGNVTVTGQVSDA